MNENVKLKELPLEVRIPVCLGHLENLSTMWISVKEYPGLQNEELLVQAVGDILENEKDNLIQVKPYPNLICKAR